MSTPEWVESDYAVQSLSPNNEYFISRINEIFYYTDPYTLKTQLAYDPPQQAVSGFTVGSNGLLGYRYGTSSYSVVDLATGQTKFNISWSQFEIATCDMSPSGKYLSCGKKIYEYNGSTFVLKGEIDSYYYGILFLANDNFLIYGDDFLKEYDINSLNIITAFDLGSDGHIDNVMQDPVSHKVICLQSGRYFLINVDTKKTYPVSAYSYNLPVLRLFNNTLFTTIYGRVNTIDCSYIEQP